MARRSVPRPETRRKMLKALEAAKRCRTWAELEKASGLSRGTLERNGLRPGGRQSASAGATAPTPEVDLTRSQHPADADARRAERLGHMCDCSTDDELRSDYFAGHMSDCPAAGGPTGGWSPPVPLGAPPPNVAYQRPRDSQRQRVYDAEQVWHDEYWTGTPPQFKEVQEARQYLLDVLAHPEVRRRFGGAAEYVRDSLKVAPLGRRVDAGGEALVQICQIRLAEDSLYETIALHELAHLLAAAETRKADHGREFANASLNLVEAVIGPDAARDLAERYRRRGAKYSLQECAGCLVRVPSRSDRHATWRRPPLCVSCLAPEEANSAGDEAEQLRWASVRSEMAERRRRKWEQYNDRGNEDEKPDLLKLIEADDIETARKGEAAINRGAAALKSDCERLRGEADHARKTSIEIAQTDDRLIDVMARLSGSAAESELSKMAGSGHPPDLSEKSRQCLAYFKEANRLDEEHRQAERLAYSVARIEAGKVSSLGALIAKQKMSEGFVFTRDEQRAINLAAFAR